MEKYQQDSESFDKTAFEKGKKIYSDKIHLLKVEPETLVELASTYACGKVYKKSHRSRYSCKLGVKIASEEKIKKE